MEQVANTVGSPLHAAVRGWKYPATREHLAILDLIDVTGAAASTKKRPWKPVPRPWEGVGVRVGGTSLPPDEAKALLARNAGRALPS